MMHKTLMKLNKVKIGSWILLGAIMWASGCGETDGVSLLDSSLTLSNPGTIYQGGQYTFSGSCSPSGSSIQLTLASATPSQINCTCSGGSLNCPATVLTAIPTPILTIQADNSYGDTSQVSTASDIPSISLNDPGYFSSGDSVTFSGTCSPDALSVNINLTSATPASISNCSCSAGIFSCPATVLNSLSTPSLQVNATNFLNSSSSQTVFTSRTAYATAASTPGVYGTSMTMNLALTGPSALPGNQVTLTSSCYNGGTCGFSSFNPGGNAVGSFSLLGFSFLTSDIFPSDNSPAYLDIVGSSDRVLTLDFGASPASLDTSGSKYYFWIAMAGLGSSPEFVTVTSNRSLKVIGYQDSFSTGDYAYLDGAATSLGSVGTAISTKPASGANGYTFYLIEDRSVSTIELTYTHGATPDPHGFILGAIEVRNQ